MSGPLPSEQSLVESSVIDYEFSLNDFTEKQQIERGGQGEVFRGYNGRLGKVAVKRLFEQVNKTEMNEVILLAKHSNHPNIIRLLGLLTLEEVQEKEKKEPNSSTLCIGYIMEYMESGSLFDVIHNTSIKYDMEQVYSWIEMASSGLQHLHERGVLHRDIKPKNILLGKSLDDLKISDFGLAKEVETQTASHTGGIGTVAYMAPELHNGTKYGKSADIYALTITFWEIIHREKPYGFMGEITPHNQIVRILNGERPNIQEELEISALLIRGWDSNPNSRPKISEFIEFSRKKQNTSVLILGGLGNLNTIYILNSKTQSCKKLSITLPMGMRNFGAVVLNEEIYIFGGISDEQQRDSIYTYYHHCYKLKNDGSWIKLASLNQKRAHIPSSSLVYKGEIWVIGGYSERPLNSVEKYNISQNKWIFFSQDKWTYMPEMNYARYDAAAAVFKDRIFVTGGYNKESLKSVEMFDPKLHKWLLFCDLPFEVFGHTMLTSNSTLSIFGGISESHYLNSIWEMDIKDPEKKWTEKQSFKHPRSSFGIGKLSNGIIVFGGYRGSGETSEIFDGNEWIDGPELPRRLSKFAYTSIPQSLEESFLKKFEEQNTSVLILGGWSSFNTIYLLDSKAQSWKKLSITLPMGMRNFGAVVLKEEIYIFGGTSDEQQRDSIYTYYHHCYKLKDDGSWMKLASLNRKRGCISSSSLVYKGDIWAIGGRAQVFLKSVEKYEISQDRWTNMPKMNYARSSAAAAVFKDRIFVTGGWNDKNLKSVEMFDPKLQKWILFCALPIEVYSHTMLISNSTLSIFGGYSKSNFSDLNSVWEMDIEEAEKKWTEKQSFNHSRSSFGIGKLSNGIIVFGGWGGSGGTSEIFDGNIWIDGPKLPQNLANFAYTSIPRSFEESFLKKFA